MITDYALAVAMFHGHDPSDVREWRWRDLELLMILSPILNNPLGGLPDG